MLSDDSVIDIAAAKVYGAKYDAICKKLFMNKEIIAPVLKEVVPEYRDCSIKTVIECIDAASMQSAPVDDTSVIASELPTELNSVSDKIIRYDTRFKALNPKLSSSKLQFFLHIDIEVQNDYTPSNPSYPVVKRALYYGARELSSQLGRLTGTTDYNALQKCYSIWICNDYIPEKIRNTVSSYSITKTDKIGKADEPASHYDLIQVIIIRRGNENGSERIFDYLTAVFNGNQNKISGYVDISNNEKLKEEVHEMSGMGMSIYKKGALEGMQQGMQQGIQQGMQKGIETVLDSLVQQGILTKEQAALQAQKIQ